jgi:hypothetical protein
MSPKMQTALAVYSAVLSSVLAIVLLNNTAKQPGPTQFNAISAQRIDIVEPNGTLRMVISNRAKLPGVIVKGKEQPKFDRPQAGMIFYNDEGSENGGLIFGGRKNEMGQVVDSGGSLSFDKYGENQIIQLAGVDDSTDRFAGLAVSDNNRRIWVGRTDGGLASVSLMDGKGRKRLSLEVTLDGVPSISFLDPNGKVLQRFSPTGR